MGRRLGFRINITPEYAQRYLETLPGGPELYEQLVIAFLKSVEENGDDGLFWRDGFAWPDRASDILRRIRLDAELERRTPAGRARLFREAVRPPPGSWREAHRLDG